MAKKKHEELQGQPMIPKSKRGLRATQVNTAVANYQVTRYLEKSLTPYKGSPDETEHKKWGGK